MSLVLIIVIVLVILAAVYLLYFRHRCAETHLSVERNMVIYSYPSPTNSRALAYYNPSIIAIKDDEYLLAIRRSDYVRYNKANNMVDSFHGHHSHLYFLRLDHLFQPVGKPVYSTIDWDTSREYEDPRITVHNNKIYISIVHIRPSRAGRRGKSFFPLLLEYSKTGNPPQLLRRIEYDRTSFGRPPYTEKNWCPFSHRGKLLLHTDSYPIWRVREVDTETGKLHTVIEQNISNIFDNNEYPHLRCSTSWILDPYNTNHYVCALHTKSHDKYRTVLVSIDAQTLLPLHYSKRLCLIPHGHNHHEKIQFVSGLLIQGKDLILTVGIADLSFDIVRIKNYHDLLIIKA